MIVYIVAALLVFGILIAVHELGHFLAAKACGVRVNEFAIGMGPVLWKSSGGIPSILCGLFRWAVSVPWRGKKRTLTIRRR